MTKKPILEFKNVSFGYEPKQTILHNLTFSINENEYVCFVGPNGSGKTTLSKIMMGILKPRDGLIKVFNKTLNKENVLSIKKKLGAVFENPDTQFINPTVEDEIAFGLENLNVNPKLIKDKVYKISKKLGIVNLLTKDPFKLSGGQKQKVAIASCLVSDPKIIIFDEATSMLDPKDKKELNDLMVLLKTKFHKTVISITHDMNEAMQADRIILLAHGLVVNQGKPIDFFQQDSLIESYNLDLPFNFKIAKKFKVKPTTNFNELVKGVAYAKK